MSTTITFKAGELKRLLANAALFAAPAKDYLPALEVVRFDWDGDHLFAVATNRYVLSWEESFTFEAECRESFSVNTADAKKIIAMIPASPRPDAVATVEYDSESGWALFTFGGNTIKANTEHGEFPKYRRLIPGDDAKAEVDTIVIGAQWLTLLAKVKCAWKGLTHGGQPVRFQFNGSKPVGVSIGEHFKAIVIPIKNVG